MRLRAENKEIQQTSPNSLLDYCYNGSPIYMNLPCNRTINLFNRFHVHRFMIKAE